MKLIEAFIKGFVIMSWLVVSFGFGMWGYSEINNLAEIRKEENRIAHKNLSSNSEDTAKEAQQNTGFTYNGIPFRSSEELQAYIDSENQERSIFITFLEKIRLAKNGDVSTSIIFILTAISYGIIGAITEQIKRIVASSRERSREVRNGKIAYYDYILKDISILYGPLFGGLVGFMAYGATSLIPLILQNTAESSFIRPTALLFFCFFSGLMSDDIYEWVTGLVCSVFKVKSNQLEAS